MSQPITRRNPLRLKPLVLASLVVTALACVTLPSRAQNQAPAQPGTQPAAQAEAPRAQRGMERPHRGDPARIEAHMAKRAADLKTKLKIEPAQEAAWSAWTAGMKPPAGLRENMAKTRDEMKTLSTPERIDRMKALRTQRDTEMDKRAQATKDFYAQLNAEQKKTFDSQPMVGPPGAGHPGRGTMPGRS